MEHWLALAGEEGDRETSAVSRSIVNPRIGWLVLPQGPILCEDFVGLSFWMCFFAFSYFSAWFVQKGFF